MSTQSIDIPKSLRRRPTWRIITRQEMADLWLSAKGLTVLFGFTVMLAMNASGSGDAPDHLEISVTNTSGAELGGFEVFYTIDDPTTNISESYYAALPTAFTVAPGASRAIHFDNTGEPDHFPVNDLSLYYTDTNALDVTVEVSATGAAPQTVSVQKDEGGVEVPD